MTTQRGPNIEKIRQLISYLKEKDPSIGKTKLMKMLYFIDFTSYERTGRAVTDDTYKHLPFGPVPSKVFESYEEQYETAPIAADLHLINTVELEIIDAVIKEFGGKTRQELINITHNELPWKLTKNNEVIPYFLAPFRSYAPLSRADREELQQNDEFMQRVLSSYRQDAVFSAA